MGYFANATEAEYWKAQHCSKCAHFHETCECPVLFAHWLWGYDDCNNKDSRLHSMIQHNGVENGKCFAFVEDEQANDPRRTELARQKKWEETFGKRGKND